MNKSIWIFWNEGYDKAPYIVRKCIDSWIMKNKKWKVNVINDGNLLEYIEFSCHPNLGHAHRSDLIRLSLLNKYGGLWVDATVYCIKPLDEWAEKYFKFDYFVFKNSKVKYGISNWFIYSKKNHPINVKLLDELCNYWDDNKLSESKIKKITKHILTSLTVRAENLYWIWLTKLIRDKICLYPYFIFHYMFREIISNDTSFRYLWEEIPFLNNDKPHQLQRMGMLSNDFDKFRTMMSDDHLFLQKLTYRIDEAELFGTDNITKSLLEGKYENN